MFAPDRQGFFAGLWVQFLQELLDVDKVEFRKITTKEERFTWMYNNRFVKVKIDDNKYEYDLCNWVWYIKRVDLRYTFSLLNIEEKVYLLKSAHFLNSIWMWC